MKRDRCGLTTGDLRGDECAWTCGCIGLRGLRRAASRWGLLPVAPNRAFLRISATLTSKDLVRNSTSQSTAHAP